GAIAKLAASLHEEYGPLYGLVNNAGIGTTGVLGLMPDAAIAELLRLNVESPVVLTKYVVRRMMSERAGRIVNISSIVAATGYHGLSVYSATKAALGGFTRSLAREAGPLGIAEVELVAHRTWIVALARELARSLLEGAGELECGHDPQEERPRVGGQLRRDLAVQLGQLEAGARHDRRHPGAAVRVRHRDAIDRHLGHAATTPDHVRDLRGRHVLSLPAEGVADPVDEIEESLRVAAHQIAAAIPGVARGERLAQHLAARGGRIGVALEASGAVIVQNLTDRLAHLVRGAAHAVAARVAKRGARLEVEAHDLDRHAVREKGRDSPDRPRATLAVVEREVAFGRGVILEDLRDAKALLEFPPDFPAQTVTAGEAQHVL